MIERGLLSGLIVAAFPFAAGRYGDLRIGSKSRLRTLSAPSGSLVFPIQISSIMLPMLVVAFSHHLHTEAVPRSA
ncbi:MAG: hypothetical protein IT541_16025 [Hyphomicrobiales bacterium]|nr:hypothetical protein [Hyphomicrobiales bacterium]